MTRWVSRSEKETEACGCALAAELVPDGVLLLMGDLGSGKTVFTRGVAHGLGISPKDIQSPTFTIIREHEGAIHRLIHVDVYRLESAEAEALGLEEILAGSGVKVVEWAERLAFPVSGARRIQFRRGASDDERVIEEISDLKPPEGMGGDL
jgi:tRNA threonylcarbamoyladenosine biosynthesis protein TsaE